MIRDILHLSMEYPGPMYIRLAQGKKDRQLYEPGTIPFSIGGSVTARDGKDVTILTHGEMVGLSLDVAEELKEEGIDVRVVDMYTIKPFDREAVDKAVEKTGNLVVWYSQNLSSVLVFLRYTRALEAGKICRKNITIINRMWQSISGR